MYDDTKQTIRSIYDHTSAAYNSIDAMGGELPLNNNMASMPDAIRSIPFIPTLFGLKKAIVAGNAATTFPPGTEIPDTYNGNSNPLIVGTYQTINNKRAVGLIRKYVEPVNNCPFGVTSTNGEYNSSYILNYFLNSTYLENCSEELKSLIAQVDVPYSPPIGDIINVPGKWHLPAGPQVLALVPDSTEEKSWELWIQRTGLTAPNVNANTGRIITDRDGTPRYWWLRNWTYHSSARTDVACIKSDGSVSNATPTSNTPGALPICYITE